MCGIYRIFSGDWKDCLSFSDDMMLELYYSESYGDKVSYNNGFYYGKKYLNLQVNMWIEDIKKGYLTKYELYQDGTFPDWWLNNVLRNI
ncbi:MAG: hypothetical protein WC679_00485 [Bacteroidales bacterium]|jgi:hypothetical protein